MFFCACFCPGVCQVALKAFESELGVHLAPYGDLTLASNYEPTLVTSRIWSGVGS